MKKEKSCSNVLTSCIAAVVTMSLLWQTVVLGNPAMLAPKSGEEATYQEMLLEMQKERTIQSNPLLDLLEYLAMLEYSDTANKNLLHAENTARWLIKGLAFYLFYTLVLATGDRHHDVGPHDFLVLVSVLLFFPVERLVEAATVAIICSGFPYLVHRLLCILDPIRHSINILSVQVSPEMEKVKKMAKEKLIRIGSAAVIPLILALERESAKLSVIPILGGIGDRRAVRPLLVLLNDRNIAVQRAAIDALGLLHDKRAVEPLMRMVKASCDPWIVQFVLEALGELRDERAIDLLIEKLVDRYSSSETRHAAIKALQRFGPPPIRNKGKLIQRLVTLRNELSNNLASISRTTTVTREVQVDRGGYWAYEGHGSATWVSDMVTEVATFTEPNPDYSNVMSKIGSVESAIRFMEERPASVSDLGSKTLPPGLNRSLLMSACTHNWIRVDSIADNKLKAFLGFLRDHDLKDIVVTGGAVRDILFDKEVNDFDITVKVPLPFPDLRRSLRPLTSPVAAEVHSSAMASLDKLARALGVTPKDFQRTVLDPPGKHFQGLEIQYVGPIEITTPEGKTSYLKRIFMESETREGFYSSTGPSLLQIGIDCEGRLYGNFGALDDLLEGKASIRGGGINFDLSNIVRLLRLKHQFGLCISAQDYEMVRETVRKYETGEWPLNNLSAIVIENQARRMLQEAQDPTAALKELETLGLIRLAVQARKELQSVSSASREALVEQFL